MIDFTAFLKIPEVLDDERVWQLRAELAGMLMNMVDVYHVDGVGKPLWGEVAAGPCTYSADGTHQVFYGNPAGDFDVESRIREVFPDSIVSSGTHFPTGEKAWVVRANPIIAATPDTTVRDMNMDVIAAAAVMEMASVNGGAGYSAQSRERIPGLNDLLREAKAHGIKDGGMFYHCGGVPYTREKPLQYGIRVMLVKGTEVLIEGPLHPELKRLESMYEGLAIHPAIPVRDVA